MMNLSLVDVVRTPEPVTTMDIALNVQVECSDGPTGRCTNIVVNRVSRCVTQLVVKASSLPLVEHLVPLKLVVQTSPLAIQLCCTKDGLARLSPFTEIFWVKADPDCSSGLYFEEYPFYSDLVPVKHYRISPIEVAIHRGTRVEATNGRAGWVDRFVIDPADGYIIDLVLGMGPLWGRKPVSIPAQEIDRFEKGAIYLKIDRTRLASMLAALSRLH